MRLKTIHARTMQEAMELVRDQMGAEAIIVATHEDEGTRGDHGGSADKPGRPHRDERRLERRSRLLEGPDGQVDAIFWKS